MLQNIKNIFKKNNMNIQDNYFDVENNSNIILDIEWEDLAKDSILKSAMTRNGIYCYATSCMLVLEDGTEYVPVQLSDHWEAYIDSPKFKPKRIIYHKLK